jgi:transcriptional regulator with XRE-family HTH domain
MAFDERTAAPTPADDNGGDGDAELVGSRLRLARQLQNARLKDIAERAGLSESYLSQLERGRTSGSIAALKRVTEALNMSMAELFQPDLGDSPRVVRRNDRRFLAFGDDARKTMLTSRPLQHLEVFIGVLDPGGSTGPEPYSHGDSEELLLVLEGSVTLQLDEDFFDLSEGDSVFYRSSTPHRASNPHDVPAEVLWAISPPTY